ncbi:MAG: DNA-binding protein [Paracoccus sp.]|uniref:helix-turn-helix transcriptional regulator n=1 Tax=Paracoccus sp. TaxID=267 RepID=UPI000C55D934|nr:helix-turn-helix transcriptional regulator [Paracoccus sp. (in: a-proteobacteria)]MBA48798.1 DNA-binding protein [Paracoccus sp. (in: a-proteobacteria)]
MSGRTQNNVLTGTRIRERRLALSRRQADVARAAGISPAYLNLIEHNRRPVSDDLVMRLSEVLEVPADELLEGHEEVRLAALREAAARLGGADIGAPETALAPDFLARFPGWAAILVAHARRSEALEAQLVSLSDRMRQDPYLLTTLHEILSAVTAIRSTASILADEAAIPAEWLSRFHANLDQDSQRLSVTAQALVAYLDSFEAEDTTATPQEEVEAWMGAGAPPLDRSPDLASDAARAMAGAHLARMEQERRALPDATLVEAAAASHDPLMIAARLGHPPDLVMRRLAALKPAGFEQVGLLVCDSAGALILRRPAPGFPLPRPGDACALWPLYQALAAPQTALSHSVETPEGRRFLTLSYATRQQPEGVQGPVITQAQMLIMPPDPARAAGPVIRIGPACRICPRKTCPACREPSILATA